MENKKHPIENDFKEAFESFTVTPNPKTWERIEQTLQKRSFIRRNKRMVSIVGGVLLLAGGFFFLNRINKEPIIPNDSISKTVLSQQPSAEESLLVIDSSGNEAMAIHDTIPFYSPPPIPPDLLFDKPDEPETDEREIYIKYYESDDQHIGEPITTEKYISDSNSSSNIHDKGAISSDSFSKHDTNRLNEEHLVQKSEDIFLPNAFTPESFENTLFKPISYCTECSLLEMDIYSRNGELIYRTKEVNLGWNGKTNGVYAQKGTYIYKISYKKQGIELLKTGFLIIL